MSGRFMLIAVFALWGASDAAQARGGELTAQGVEFFESKIRPVLVQRCYNCHSSKSEEVKGGLLVDTKDGLRNGGDSGAAVVPKSVDESLLIQAIRYESFEMPPGEKLPDEQPAR